ncbi:peptidase [Gallaecimonas kandeliae]|uniref:peptidase n=1 Tax=Gallaecimonas kandeliae TaxID=3029055 RepID=UPI00264919C5|nr:peptidase [Gallaecimonas kandeliae]WKE65066.1 peptidase [Gallaecimonas kandeliae]
MSALEIFKAGTHTAMDGQQLSFSAADIAASVAAYDPAVFKAPLVVGHPKLNDPAYGWVRSVAINGEVMQGEPEQVEAQFAEMVNNGRFPRISASFFHPDSPSNPVPGVWYLRHVGFLGAQAPAVKGLKPASFAEAGDGEVVTVEFAANGEAPGAWALTRILRGLREFLIEDRNSETADKVIPDWLITSYEEDMRREAAEGPTHFSEPEETEMDPTKTADFAARESALQSREAELAQREQQYQAKEAEARKAGIASFADGLVKEGKVLPRDREGLVAFMAHLDEASVVEFADGDQSVKKAGVEWFKGFLGSLPQQVDYAEHGATQDEHKPASFAAPQGYSVDPDRLALHNKALAYQVQHQCDYNTAINAVS